MQYRASWVALFAVAACQDNVKTPFPPGLEPFDDGNVPAQLDGTPTEQLRTSTSEHGMHRAYGRGFVLAPPSTVWAVAHMPDVMIAKCHTTTQTVMPDNEPEFELSFLVHYYVNDIVDVSWDDQWRGAVVTGTPDAPLTAMTKHQKVQGSDYITTSEGTIEIIAVDAMTTELQFVEHLDALGGSTGDLLSGMQHTYDGMVAVSHGNPAPPCP